MVFMAGVASAFEGPARQSLLPALVPRNLFSRAMTLNSTLQSLSARQRTGRRGGVDRLAGHRPELRRALRLVLVSMLVLLPVRVADDRQTGRAGCALGRCAKGWPICAAARSCSAR